MSEALCLRLFEELDWLVLIDPHTHIDPHAPSAKDLSEILGYHYYTELAHSAGMPRGQIEEPGLDPREKVRRLAAWLPALDNTIQSSWLVEMARSLFDFDDDQIGPHNWELLYDAAEKALGRPNWCADVLKRSRIEAVFLTNYFDDPLAGFDTKTYVPCLRTDDLVFRLARPAVRERLERASGNAVGNVDSLTAALGKLFEHFVSRGARACAISLPASFAPVKISRSDAARAQDAVWREGEAAEPARQHELSNFVFWTLAEHCAAFKLPFDLMIGVERQVYTAGVYQGCDLYDSRVSLIQYRDLFNAFPTVTFPISVLASVTNQELTSYSWIFPNVVTHGHWWYSNTPTFIAHDAAARLEAVPRTKQIGYYSDMYKRLLARILAQRFVIERGWSEDRAAALGRQVLRGNVERIFYGAT
jgi:glucuronate isomerase